jgi:hypothetical protein
VVVEGTKTLKSSRPKRAHPVADVRRLVSGDAYIFSRHALERLQQRQVTVPEVRHVLLNGFHESRKDEWRDREGAWNYAIRGKTVDERELRVCVTFLPGNLLVVTVIDLR